MKRTSILFVVALGLALPAFAQEDFKQGEMTFGILQRDSDTISSKFLEYRDIPQGPVASYLNFIGKKGDLRYRLWGADVTQKDQRYFGYIDNGTVRLDVSYTGIPHNFGNGGTSILSPTTETSWQLPNTLQAAYQGAIALTPGAQVTYPFLANLVAPALAAAPSNVDLKLQRDRTQLGFHVTPKTSNFDVGVTYFHERRSGTRANNGTSFGFGNVVETPEPLRYITQDVGANAAYKGDWGTVHAGVRFNDFKNAFNTFSFDNPFRATDGTDPSAYQSPGSASKNGAVFGTMALPPDNKAVSESLGGTFKLGTKTHLTADLAFGQWSQNKDPFIAWTTNTAILTSEGVPAITAPLPASKLDGKIDTTSLNAFFTTKVTNDVGVNARYRHYDSNNKTPRYQLPDGYVRFDAVWEEIPRITVPYGYTSDYFDAYATWSRGVLGLEAGWKYNKMKRTFRESDDTTEHVFRVAADVHGGSFTLRGIGEFGSRDYSNYDAAASEDASFLQPGAPANQTVLRRVDQAKRDLTRVGGQAEFSPGSGKFNLFASYTYTQFKYNQDPVPCEDVDQFPGQGRFCPGGVQTPLGMIHDKYNTFTAEASYTPTERVTAYAFYTWEDGDVLQDGRQSGATVDFNPADVWTANLTNKGNTVGAGADFTLVPEKWFLNLFARYQKINGNNDTYLQPGFSTAIYTTPGLGQCTSPGANPCSIAAFDDTELTYVTGSVKYQFAAQWSTGVGVGYEKYTTANAQTDNALNYMPASFFLQANNGNYRAWVGYFNVNYKW
jgi:putative beta-barrel porin MtrB/PioB